MLTGVRHQVANPFYIIFFPPKDAARNPEEKKILSSRDTLSLVRT